jgi:hypothetical protein
MEVGSQRRATEAVPPGKIPGNHCAGGWVSGLVSTDLDNLAPAEIRSPERPARSESLYRLSYPGTRQHILLHKESLSLSIAFIKRYYV